MNININFTFQTGLLADGYNPNQFPQLDLVPRIGEKVSVKRGCEEYVQKGYPTCLEVTDITYGDFGGVTCELGYRKLDLKTVITLRNIKNSKIISSKNTQTNTSPKS